jgi:hypothetical protein
LPLKLFFADDELFRGEEKEYKEYVKRRGEKEYYISKAKNYAILSYY